MMQGKKPAVVFNLAVSAGVCWTAGVLVGWPFISVWPGLPALLPGAVCIHMNYARQE